MCVPAASWGDIQRILCLGNIEYTCPATGDYSVSMLLAGGIFREYYVQEILSTPARLLATAR